MNDVSRTSGSGSLKDCSAGELCSRLSMGWSAEHAELPCELMARLVKSWRGTSEGDWRSRSAWRTVIELNHVRLHGTSEIGCLVLSAGAEVGEEMASFRRRFGHPGKVSLIFALQAEAIPVIYGAGVSTGTVILTPDDVLQLLTSTQSLESLKEQLRKQIPSRFLLGFDIIHPVSPNMFFGRRDILDRFHHEPTTNFAVAGPGRIGKSSLLKQYWYELRKRRDVRATHLTLIDCYSYSHYSPDEFARRIAMEFRANSAANRVTMDSLQRFLKWNSEDGEMPLELLFDEVDLVCNSEAFQHLAEAAKDGFCRFIMCGKGPLHKMMRSKDAQLAARLELIQPDPFERTTADHLLVDPLTDAGYVLEESDKLRECVWDLAHGMPHLIQACAKQLVEAALAEGTTIITPAHFEKVHEEFTPTLYGNLPLDSLQDDETRLVALLLLRSGCGTVTVGRLQQLAEKEGGVLSAQRALDICYDLWICNILTRQRGNFVLANQTMVTFFRSLGMSREISRLLLQVWRPSAA